MVDYYAHTNGPDQSNWQPLRVHLENVARLARRFAEEARPGDESFAKAAENAGWLHDLGKYRPEFQEYIRGKRGRGESTGHKQIGASHAIRHRCADLAFAVWGHHGGLPNKADMVNAAAAASEALAPVLRIAAADCPSVPSALSEWGRGIDSLVIEFRTRLLFSCLVDADWLDTSAHEAGAEGWPQRAVPPALDAEGLLPRVRAYIDRRSAGCLDAKMASLRAVVLRESLAGATHKPGLFAMTVPTGGGKTLASLGFALEHCRRHDLRRVVYVAPYLSVIEQNARVYREALGDTDGEWILEHHSMVEPASDSGDSDPAQTASAARLAENWDSPVVLTTSVQFFESLFSKSAGRCRKLHNLARSVVILDECQTLPPGLIAPTCQMLQQAADYLGSTFVLCTATQPAWNRDASLLPEGLEGVREIVPAGLDLPNRLRRVEVAWPADPGTSMEWDAVVDRMTQDSQSLCVVNTKQAAREVFSRLRLRAADVAFHLSTAMCPAHRLHVLDRVRGLLADGKPCHLVSTQLIEAGVDVDFPLLLRELAPLEAIVQAAGRCNRESRLHRGQVIVFRSVDGKLPPDAWYRNGVAVVKQDFLGSGRAPDIHVPAHLSEYFRRLYRTGELDGRRIMDKRRSLDFADVSGEYRLIDDATTSLVVTQWTPGADEVESLLNEIRLLRSPRAYRRLQRYSVNVYGHDLRRMGGGVILDFLPGINRCDLPYDSQLGLVPGVNTGALVY